MSGTGRRLDSVWTHFITITDSKAKSKYEKRNPIKINENKLISFYFFQGKRVKCKTCGTEMVGLVGRMRKHKETCKSLTESTPQTECDGDGDDENADDNNQIASSSSEVNSPVTVAESATISSETTAAAQTTLSTQEPATATSVKANVRPKACQTLSNFVVKTTASDKAKIDMQLARCVYATNSSFSLASHSEFVKLCETLRPGYKPPNRKLIGGKFLDAVFDEEMTKCKNELEGEKVCLSFDGWENVRNEPILSAAVTKDNGDVFLVDSIDASGITQTSANLLTIASNAIKKTEEKFGCTVLSFVSDNCSAMVKMRKNLAGTQLRDPTSTITSVISYGCGSHYLNLMAEDICEINSSKKIIKVCELYSFYI